MLTRKISKAGRQGRVSEVIARRIQNAISDGKLQSGEKLPAERDLAKRLNVSRVSVREAYRALVEMGLLVIKRGAEGGAFICDIDHQPVTRSLSLMLQLGRTSHEEITEARILLEPPIARLAALRADGEDVARLEDLVRRQEQALKGNGSARKYDLQFHRLVAQCAKNLPLLIVMNALADLALEAISTIDISHEVKKHVLNFHRTILEAIKRRDGEAAYTIMLRHVRDVQSRLGKAFVRQLRMPAAAQRSK